MRSHVILAVLKRNVMSYFSGLLGYLFIVVFVIAVAAAEAAVGLGILLAFFRNKETVNIDEMNVMRW